MFGKINIGNLVRQLLPAHKRQPIRLNFLTAFVWPLQSLLNSYCKWRSDTLMIINVTSQVIVFEAYLRKKYGQPIRIKIVSYDDGLISVGLVAEGTNHRLETGLKSEELLPIPLSGEMRELFGDVDFAVYIPAGVDVDSVRADIERFKQTMVKYKIIQN